MEAMTAVNTTLTAVAKVIDYFKNNVAGHLSDSSLTSITKLTRSEPYTIISNDCANLEYLPDILNALVSVYSGYYLQAVFVLTRVNNVEVIRLLDRLNPDRDSTGFLLQGRETALESAASALLDSYRFSLPTRNTFALEATDANDPRFDQINQKTIYETSNLAIGKLLSVDIAVTDKNGCEQLVKMPVSIRLFPAVASEETLSYIFTHRKGDDSFFERLHGVRSGRLSFFRDAVMCQDLIDEYRRAALKDKSGVLKEITRRVNANRAYGLLTKNPSLAISSNLYVLSLDSARKIEAKVGYRFSDPKGRERILKDTYAMIIAVVDIEKEMITMYFNGIAAPAMITRRSLASSSKNKGPDIADVMRSLLQGQVPSF